MKQDMPEVMKNIGGLFQAALPVGVLSAKEKALLKQWRGKVKRRIGLFDSQFNAGRTLCRSRRHHEARRRFKVLSHDPSRHLNRKLRRPRESAAHFRLAA